MRISDAIKVDHEFRYYRKATTLLQTIATRMQWYTKNMPTQITPLNKQRAAHVQMRVERELSREKIEWEILLELSARPLLKVPTKEILWYIFYTLPQPRPAQISQMEAAIVEIMNQRLQSAAANAHKFELMCEIAYRAYHGYYIIFNTLTVREGEYYAVFNKSNRSYQDYVRKFERLCAHGRNHLPSETSTRDANASIHFAVTEAGDKNGRLHIHSIHLLRTLPREARDPNYGRTRPDRRELTCLYKLWPHGRSAPIIVRYSPGDAWGVAGYRWPLDHKTGEPQQVKSPLALANYVSKYINKGYASCQRKKLLWRVKKSHKLGQQILNELVARLSTSTLILLTTHDNLKTKLNQTRIPQVLLRKAALRQLQSRSFSTRLKDYDLTALAKLASPRLSPLHYSRASIQTIQENNHSNTQYLSTLGLQNEDTYRTAWQELYDQSKIINDKYFPTKRSDKYGTYSIRDHIYYRPGTNPAMLREPNGRNAGSNKTTPAQTPTSKTIRYRETHITAQRITRRSAQP